MESRSFQNLIFFCFLQQGESTYLVSPPHHQVGEAGDPADGTEERDWKELL